MTAERTWTRSHLLGLEELSADEILSILDTAQSLKEVSTRSIKKVPRPPRQGHGQSLL